MLNLLNPQRGCAGPKDIGAALVRGMAGEGRRIGIAAQPSRWNPTLKDRFVGIEGAGH